MHHLNQKIKQELVILRVQIGQDCNRNWIKCQMLIITKQLTADLTIKKHIKTPLSAFSTHYRQPLNSAELDRFLRAVDANISTIHLEV